MPRRGPRGRRRPPSRLAGSDPTPPPPPPRTRIEGLPAGVEWYDVPYLEPDPDAFVLPARLGTPGAGYRFGVWLDDAALRQFVNAVGDRHAVFPYAAEGQLFRAAAAGMVDVAVVGLDAAECAAEWHRDGHLNEDVLRTFYARHRVEWTQGRATPLLVYAAADGPGTAWWRERALTTRLERGPVHVVVAGVRPDAANPLALRAARQTALQHALDALWVDRFVVAVQYAIFPRLTRVRVDRARRLLGACAAPDAACTAATLADAGPGTHERFVGGRRRALQRELADAGLAPARTLLRALRVGHLYHRLRAPEVAPAGRTPWKEAGFRSERNAESAAVDFTGLSPETMAARLTPAELLSRIKAVILAAPFRRRDGRRLALSPSDFVPPYWPPRERPPRPANGRTDRRGGGADRAGA